MDENLAARILLLPESVRATLATVEGSGWYVSRRNGDTILHDYASYAHPEPMGQRGAGFTDAWWPADPVASVAAVLGCSMFVALGQLRHEVGYWQDDVHAAALAIIEQRVAAAVPAAARQSVVNLGKVGEVINLQGPVTLSIGADGVKVVR